MKIIAWLTNLTLVGTILFSVCAVAQEPPKIDPEKLEQLKAAGFETNPEVFKELATGGRPMGCWKEGLMFEGIEPMPWLKSAANWAPRSEDVQPDEIRVTFMGSSPVPRLGHFR